jgi:hypothetical protein
MAPYSLRAHIFLFTWHIHGHGIQTGIRKESGSNARSVGSQSLVAHADEHEPYRIIGLWFAPHFHGTLVETDLALVVSDIVDSHVRMDDVAEPYGLQPDS